MPAGVPLIWIIPIVLGAGALAGVGILFWRRSRDFGVEGSCSSRGGRGMSVDRSPGDGAPGAAPGDERWYLTDEREFLRAFPGRRRP